VQNSTPGVSMIIFSSGRHGRPGPLQRSRVRQLDAGVHVALVFLRQEATGDFSADQARFPPS